MISVLPSDSYINFKSPTRHRNDSLILGGDFTPRKSVALSAVRSFSNV